jgi:hypothetical protein
VSGGTPPACTTSRRTAPRALAERRAGHLAFFLRRQIRSWIGEPPALHSGLKDWLERVVAGAPGWHFDTAEATLKELLELGADLQPEAAERVEDAVRHFSHATTLLNEYVTLSEGERARRAGQVKTARADLLACVNSLEAMVPPKLLGPSESQALPPRLRR